MGSFDLEKSIFANDEVLDENYQPDEFLAREDEEETFISSLFPLARASQPDNIFVYGQTGTGKTCATQVIIDELKADSQDWDHDVRIIWGSCQDRTNYKMTIELVNRLRDEDNQIPHRGLQEGRVMDILLEEIDALPEEHVVLILDEVDHLGDDPGLLYQIPRARSNNKIEDTKIGIVAISNNFRFYDTLEPKTLSTFKGTDIHFDPYNAEQLQLILEDRIDDAFEDGALEEGVIQWICAKSAQDTGSARHALNVLKRSGRIAETDGDPTVTEDHARNAYEAVREDRIVNQLRSLQTQNHILMYSLALLKKDGRAPASREQIYTIYESVADRLGVTPKKSRTIHNDLNELGFSGFVTRGEENAGKGGGRHYTYDLNMPLDAVIRGLEEETDLIPESKTGKEDLNHSLARYQ